MPQLNTDAIHQLKQQRAAILSSVLLLCLLVVLPASSNAQEVLEGFELGQGEWFADNGSWEIGSPTFGPAECHQGDQCAGTVLDGNYPRNNSRLISPPVRLNEGGPADPVLLRFWQWFSWATARYSYESDDRGVVQVSVYDETLSVWSDWITASSTFSGSSGVWALNIVDLTAYSTKLVKVAFYHQGAPSSNTDAGWYVDEVGIPGTAIPPEIFTVLQDFELGQGNWFADNGVWEVGSPTVGPAECYQGDQCAGTILDGNYPRTNSRLISPPVQLNGASAEDRLLLSFWHWFSWATARYSYESDDRGVVQVSVYDETLSMWSDWITASSTFSRSSGVWTLNIVDLTAFSDELVRISFYHVGSRSSATGAGWYVDEISIGTVAGGCMPSSTLLCLPEDDRFEVSVYFETVQGGGQMGNARAVSLDSLGIGNGGIFVFDNPANPEFLVKILDGCAINNRYWVFYAATTNVGFELTVTDTVANQTQVFINPDLNPADAITDTMAFATCP